MLLYNEYRLFKKKYFKHVCILYILWENNLSLEESPCIPAHDYKYIYIYIFRKHIHYAYFYGPRTYYNDNDNETKFIRRFFFLSISLLNEREQKIQTVRLS